MTKKNVLWGLLGLGMLACLFAGCLSTPPAVAQSYPTGTELYPAVYGTINEKVKDAKFADIDFYNNVYRLTNLRVLDGTLPKRFDLVVKLLPTGNLDITYENMYMQDAKTNKWVETNGFLFYNWKKFTSELSGRMVEIANNSGEYAKFEKAAMADIYFVYAIMRNFTGVAFKDFIEKYAKGSVFVLEGPVSDVKEANETINGIPYKYLVTMNKKLVDDDTSYIGFFDTVYCRFYTNRDDVIRLSKTSVYKVSANLVSASQGAIGNSVVLTLAADS